MTAQQQLSPPKTVGLSGTEMEMWKRCPRKWYIEQYLGFLPADPSPVGARNIGIRIHLALEGKYGYGLDPLMIIDLLYRSEIAAHEDYETELRSDWDMSRIMVEGYLEEAQAQGWDDELEVIATEAEVRVPLPGFENYVDLRAKLDQVVRDRQTGLLSYLDHKTAESFKREELIRNDPQMRRYSLIQWLASGQPPPMMGQATTISLDASAPLVMGGIINTLRKVRRSSSSKPPYYMHTPFRHTTEQMATTLAGIQQVASEIMNARRQLDEAYARGGRPEQINWLQATILRPVWILHDCSWSCPWAAGLCQMMDDGSDWGAALVDSGRYVQGDPYERYERGGLEAIRAQLQAG